MDKSVGNLYNSVGQKTGIHIFGGVVIKKEKTKLVQLKRWQSDLFGILKL